MSDTQLIAAYETYRLQLLSQFVGNPDLVAAPLAFAYENRICPVYHHELQIEIHGKYCFEDVFRGARSREFLNELFRYIDDLSRRKNFDEISFTKLEDKFGGYKANRMEIAHGLRYAYLSDAFDREVYSAILEESPM